MNDDEAIQNIHKKIEREKVLLNAAIAMRTQTNNEAVRSRLDGQMRDGRRNLQFFEEKLQELQMRRVNQGMGDMSMGGSGAQGQDGPPPPPPKDSDAWGPGDVGNYGTQQYSKIGAHGDLMPPRNPYAPQAPGANIPKARPNFTKLGMSILLCGQTLACRALYNEARSPS